ncbi:MAG TPA: inorganic diphosphatase [Flavipsychrobacter sp.]|nr:inorganic diphosphatase [Flavipsychrobacter sp.]
MKLKKIPACSNGIINVIIETPKGSQNKYDYVPEAILFKLKKTLPMGSVFPFDFGFIPNTKAEDSDPVDVLVIMDEHAYPGCLIECRVIGAIEAEQTEKNGKKNRNDRIVAVSNVSMLYSDVKHIDDLNKKMISEIEQFFINYNEQEGRKFKILSWVGPNSAFKLVKKCRV